MKVETWSTSRVTEKAKEIVLRQGPHARLVFAPTIVENLRNPAACIKGEFFYEKKALKDAWIPDRQMSLASLKTGEGYALALKSEEVLTLLQQLRPLYTLYEQHGIQSGQNTWLLVPDAPEEDLLSLLNSQSEEALKSMRILLRWVASSPNGERKKNGSSSSRCTAGTIRCRTSRHFAGSVRLRAISPRPPTAARQTIGTRWTKRSRISPPRFH